MDCSHAASCLVKEILTYSFIIWILRSRRNFDYKDRFSMRQKSMYGIKLPLSRSSKFCIQQTWSQGA
jgi:hypothetical protein